MSKRAKWKYTDARGVEKTGYYVRSMESQGSDVTYVFEDEEGTIDVVSGERLKKARRVWE